jgi:hypothetical protein
MSHFSQDERERIYNRHFSFEGFIGDNSEVLPRHHISGHFERITPFLMDITHQSCGKLRWFADDVILHNSISLELYAETDHYQEILRFFSTVSGAAAGNVLSIDLTLTHEKWNTEGFWQTGWHNEDLRVFAYRFYSRGNFKSKDLPPIE